MSLFSKEGQLTKAYKNLNEFLRNKCERRKRESAGLGGEIYFCKVNDEVSIMEEVKPYSEKPREKNFSELRILILK